VTPRYLATSSIVQSLVTRAELTVHHSSSGLVARSGSRGRPFVVFAGAGCGGHGEVGFGHGSLSGAGAGLGAEDEDHGVIERTALRIAFAVWVMLGTAVLDTFAAELAEGDRVTAGLGEEVAAEAEHVRPLAHPRATPHRAAELSRVQIRRPSRAGARSAALGDMGATQAYLKAR
jgi:hypothetical protein